MKQTLLYLTLLIAFGTATLAQTLPPSPEQCATMQMDSLLRVKFPQLGSLNDFEQALQKRITTLKAQAKSGRVAAPVITIPIIVHVVHNGEAVGAGRNISQAQVQSQLVTLNEDFRRQPRTRGFNDSPVGADIEIEFCLAAVDRQGRAMAEPGIDRYNGGRATWGRDDIEGVLKPSTFWDPNKYFNVWVLDFDSADRLLGYAQFPSQSNLQGIPTESPASTDGVVIAYRSFGNAEKGNFPIMQAPYNLGRTMTHETGHWLGLRHIWGDANCGNDFVDDTPAQASESRGCQIGRISCGGVNMVQNYMDYSDDGCFNIFTLGQKARMRAVMDLSPRRVSLITSNVCGTQVAAAPIPNFRAASQRTLLGGSVRFNDLSGNFPTRWEWTFEGGTPATSTEQNPVVTYDKAGRYRVTLRVTNSIGTSQPLVREQYIEVLNSGLCAELTNFNGTSTVLREVGGTGYVAGQNSKRSQAVSEFFQNELNYNNLAGTAIKFGVAKAIRGAATESVVTVTVWNGRGFQNGPGAILEQKDVPLRDILADVANNRPTVVTFERNVPLSGLPYHIGVIFPYAAGDTIALTTTQNGQSTFATSWRQNRQGDWLRYADSLGINVAHNITARIGMKSSVQVASSAIFISPGETVTLNARGASVFSWSGPGLNTNLGPQVVASPTQTTSYTVSGSGTDLCSTSAVVTVNVRTGTVTALPEPVELSLTVSPNPSDGQMVVTLTNPQRGAVTLTVRSLTGAELFRQKAQKTTDTFQQPIDLRTAPGGMYIIEVKLGDETLRRRVLKQ
ncbi:MAG: PKD domain-containing protein [Spirosoma sp.]|nr:PKD domain-containing protein [Spirosoma sp.]